MIVAWLTGCAQLQLTHGPTSGRQNPELRKKTVERFVLLLNDLSQNKNAPLGARPPEFDPWQHRDWRKVFSHCLDHQGDVGSEIIWGGSDVVEDDSIRFVCNTAPKVNGKRVVEGDKFWATPWYTNGDLERRSFYLERFLTGVALIDGASLPGMLDAAESAPYDASFALLKGYWPAMVPPDVIDDALSAWSDRAFAKPESRGRTAER